MHSLTHVYDYPIQTRQGKESLIRFVIAVTVHVYQCPTYFISKFSRLTKCQIDP